MKRKLLALTILAIIGTGIYFNIQANSKDTQTVETYCSTVHAHNVADYKACKVLKPTQILTKLTKAEENRYNLEVPPSISLIPLK